MNTVKSDVTIVGSGVIGLACAYYLSKLGLKITVIGRGNPPKHASWAAAGILSPLHFERYPEQLLRACYKSFDLYPELSEQIKDHAGIDVQLVKSGMHMLVIDKQDSRQISKVKHHLKKHQTSFQNCNTSRICKALPFITKKVKSSVFLPDIFQIKNNLLLEGLRRILATMNVKVLSNQNATHITVQNNKVREIKTTDKIYRSSFFIVSTGPWLNEILTQTSITLKMTPVKGYIILARSSSDSFSTIIKHKDFYIVPRLNGDILIGSTLENAGFDEINRLGAINYILDNTLKFAPGAAKWKFEQVWSGLRPLANDRPPIIDKHPKIKNLIIAGGHYRNGIMLAPITGQLVCSLISGQNNLDEISGIFRFR
ncbi:MAG: FAD-dependent oxidoreductase [Planctomycetes bacterium]|nr:FAD-dependent oxidoreductase [Planctomycetota bacterium]